MGLAYAKEPRNLIGNLPQRWRRRATSAQTRFGSPSRAGPRPEDFIVAVQGVMGSLQDMGVHSIQECSMYVVPLRKSGQRMDLADEDGQVLEDFTMELPDPAVEGDTAWVQDPSDPLTSKLFRVRRMSRSEFTAVRRVMELEHVTQNNVLYVTSLHDVAQMFSHCVRRNAFDSHRGLRK